MSLDRSNMPLSAKQIFIMNKNGKFNYDHIVQRGLVWERTRKSALIESMILGYPIPQIYCRRNRGEDPTVKRNSTYVVMDGKQRLTTIASFINNEWPLSVMDNIINYTTYDGYENFSDISNMYFDQLPEEIQDKIKDTCLNFICFDDINPAEERELFKRLNAGKPLSAKARLIVNCKDLENIINIGDHSLFKNILSESARAQKTQVALVMKMWTMLNFKIEDISFESKNFNAIVGDREISKEEHQILQDVMDLMNQVYMRLHMSDSKSFQKTAKKFATETHLISFTPFFLQAYKDGYDDVHMLADWIMDFFNEQDAKKANGTSEYYDACTKGSAKNENIRARHYAIADSYQKFTTEAN